MTSSLKNPSVSPILAHEYIAGVACFATCDGKSGEGWTRHAVSLQENMNSDEIVKSRAHRILRPLKQYREPMETDPRGLVEPEGQALRIGEKIIGIYENQPGQLQDSIVVTSLGVHVLIAAWVFAPFDQIDHVQVALKSGDKSSVEELVVHLQSGGQVHMPVRGGNRKFRDVWEVLRFLNRVVSHRRKLRSN